MMFTRRVVMVGVVLMFTTYLDGARAAENVEVKISNFTFNPAEITIHVGDTVTFKNEDDIPHSVVGKDGSFKLKVMDTNETRINTFITAGEFGFFCGLHPHMVGKVIVTP